jgi:hypothetical protein
METIDNLFILEEIKKIEGEKEVEELYFQYTSNYYTILNKNSQKKSYLSMIYV